MLKQTKILLVTLFLSILSESVFAQTLIQKGDLAYASRSDQDSVQIDLAIQSYSQALELEPNNFDIYFKLIEALYFKGYFVAKEQSQKEKIFDKVLKLSEKTIALLSRESDVDLKTLSINEQAEKVKNNIHAAPTYFWNSISWGLWGMTFGNFASARKDVAAKVRDAANVLILVDPKYANGGGYRLLGRLHTVAPKIPFFTYWVDRAYGIELLIKANQISIEDPRNQLFLAEALLKYQTDKEQQALEFLRSVSNREPLESYRVEQLETINEAKKRLKDYE